MDVVRPTEISRLEIHVKRLLSKCEEMAKDKSANENWRFAKYLQHLEEMISELKSSDTKPNPEDLNAYCHSLGFLKGVLNVQHATTPLEKALTLQVSPKQSNEECREIQQMTQERINSELRSELFDNESDGLRLRRPTLTEAGDVDSDDVDSLLKRHHSMQEKIAENMLVLVKNIKEQSQIAGNIIKNDTKNVDKSSTLAETNIDRLKTESEKLHEQSRKAFRCWIWVMMIFVILIFTGMVLLMKILKKRA